MSQIGCKRRSGFALLPVVLALALLGATAYLMTRESASGVALVASAQQTDRARYVAEAALRHATWQLQLSSCDGFSDVPTTSFGADSYSATVTPTSRSPITVAATGTLADGTSHTLTRAGVKAYEAVTAVIFQLTSGPGKDTILDSFYDIRNCGGASYLQVNSQADWTQRSLIQFDLSSIPAGVEVISARLELKQWNVNVPGRVSVHQVTRDWVEGTKTCGGTADGASWPTFDGTQAWALPGGDFDPAPASEAHVTNATDDQWMGWEVGGLVEGWLADPASNHGMLLRGEAVLREAKFASREASNPNDAPRLRVVYSCECGQVCGAGGATRVLYVVADPANPSAQEAARQALMQSWGFSVTRIDDDADKEKFYTEMAVNDAAYVSQEAIATTLGAKLNASVIGVVNESKDMIDDFGFTTGLSLGGGLPTLNVDPDHYITSVFESSPIAPYVANEWYQIANEPVAAGVDPVGTWVEAPWAGKPALMALSQGADLIGGGKAAGRRVQIPWGSGQGATPVAIASLSDDAKTVMKRAIEWAAGTQDVILLVVGDATTLSAKDSGRKALMESWGFSVNLIDDGDTQTNFDAAVDAADVVFVSGTSSGPALLDKLTGTATPVVNELAGKLDNFGFSSSTSATVLSDGFAKTDALHYITEPFSGNAVTVFHTYVYSMPVPSGTLAPDLQNVAEVLATPTLVALDTGAKRWDGNPAPGRRVHLPLGAAETTQLTADGETIMQRALEWAAGTLTAETGPTAHWKLDETSGDTAVDSAGGHHGTLTNDPSWNPGTIDGGLSFDGSDDFVDVPHDDTLSLTTFSISAWIRATVLSGWQTVVNKGTTTSDLNYYLSATDDEIALGFYSSGWVEFITTGANLSTHRWYHVAGTFDAAIGEAKIYLDGTPIHTGTTAKNPLPNSQALTIGRNGFGEYWTGMLDDVRIYDLVLSADEVTELAGMGGSGCTGTFRDEFNAEVWSGSDGTLAWATDWLEWGEGGTPTGGDIMVMDDMGPYSARIRDNGTSGAGAGIRREADLSAYASATLSFDFRRAGPDDAADYVTADVSDDGGATWTELDRFEGEGNGTEDPTYQSRSYDITGYLAPNTRIRFQSSPDFGTQDVVYFDNVEICVGD